MERSLYACTAYVAAGNYADEMDYENLGKVLRLMCEGLEGSYLCGVCGEFGCYGGEVLRETDGAE